MSGSPSSVAVITSLNVYVIPSLIRTTNRKRRSSLAIDKNTNSRKRGRSRNRVF